VSVASPKFLVKNYPNRALEVGMKAPCTTAVSGADQTRSFTPPPLNIRSPRKRSIELLGTDDR